MLFPRFSANPTRWNGRNSFVSGQIEAGRGSLLPGRIHYPASFNQNIFAGAGTPGRSVRIFYGEQRFFPVPEMIDCCAGDPEPLFCHYGAVFAMVFCRKAGGILSASLVFPDSYYYNFYRHRFGDSIIFIFHFIGINKEAKFLKSNYYPVQYIPGFLTGCSTNHSVLVSGIWSKNFDIVNYRCKIFSFNRKLWRVIVKSKFLKIPMYDNKPRTF